MKTKKQNKTKFESYLTRFADAFESKTRDNGQKFIVLKESARAEFSDIVRAAHGTDFMPDDFRFQTIEFLVWGIKDRVNFEELKGISADKFNDKMQDLSGELIDSLVDIYNKDLTAWLDSHLYRAQYVDDAVQELGYPKEGGLFQALKYGQYKEIEEIFNSLVNEIAKNFKPSTKAA